MRLLLIIFAAAILTACAATGPVGYGAAQGDDFGYSESRIEDGRYRIVYRGSGGMPPEVVDDYALRRAAELTLQDGYDWFRIISGSMDHDERGGVSLGAGFGTGSYGRRGGTSVGVGGNFGQVGAQDFFTARIEVLMGKGETPDSDAYDAASIAASLGGGQYQE